MDQASWQKAKDVLYDAQRLPGPEREAYVRRHFKHQPDVCDEVLAILPDRRDAATLQHARFSTSVLRYDELADLQPSTPIKHYTIVPGCVAAAWDRCFWRSMRSCGAPLR